MCHVSICLQFDMAHDLIGFVSEKLQIDKNECWNIMDIIESNEQGQLSKKQGQRIISLRKETLLSRKAFSQKYDIPLGSLQNWESGRYQSLTKHAVDVLINAFAREGINCTADWLLYGKATIPITRNIPLILPLPDVHIEKSLFEEDIDLINRTKAHNREYLTNKELYEVTRQGITHDVFQLIKHRKATLHKLTGLKLRLYDENENTLLHLAAINGYLELVKYFCAIGIPINCQNLYQFTPLHFAIINNRYHIAEYLIKTGAIVDAIDDKGRTSLSLAAQLNNDRFITLLISNGANIHATDYLSNTPLHWACYYNKLNIVKKLIEYGAKLTSQNTNGEIPLQYAVNNGNVDIVHYLLNIAAVL